MKHIQVTAHFNQYNPGEVASFDDTVAADILKRGLGREVQLDRKNNLVIEPVPGAADKPAGTAAPTFDAIPEGSTTADAPAPAAPASTAAPSAT